MLRLENVEKHYESFHLNCSLKLEPGMITGIIGPNGAGKTTIFKAALGLIDVEAGTAEVFGKRAGSLTPKDRENFGVVLADSGFSGYLSIRDLIPVLDRLYSRFNKEEFISQCRSMGLPMNKKIKEFSTGMRAKLKVLFALSHEADLLILDEPTSGLDVIARNELLDCLRDYMEREGRSMLVSSHISSDLESICDDLYLINQGRILLHEETDVLLSEYGLIKATEDQFKRMDQTYILRYKKEAFGYSCLTADKQYYLENYPEIVVEKSNIDYIITMMVGGEQQ